MMMLFASRTATIGKAVAGAALLSLAAGSSALAQDGVQLTFNVGAASDYVFRGVSQTDEEPQVFGGVDATFASIGYAGVWASNVDFGDSTDAEVDVYAGVRPKAGPVNFDLGVVHYGYVNQPSGADWDFWEGKVAAYLPVGPATLGAAVYYSPEFTAKTGEAWYTEVSASGAIPETKFSVSGAVGHQAIDEAGDYTTWNLGVGYAFTDNIGIDLRYHDTDGHEFGKLYDRRVVVSLKYAR